MPGETVRPGVGRTAARTPQLEPTPNGRRPIQVRHRRTWLAAAAVLAVGGAVGGQARVTRPVPVNDATAPADVVTSTTGPGVGAATVTWLAQQSFCAVNSPLADRTGDRTGAPHLDTDPDRAHLAWLPRTNATRAECTFRTTTAGAPVARRLASELNDSTAEPDGPRSCPADVGLAVLVSLHSGVGWQTAQVDTTGCATLVAAGFRPREPSA